MGITCVSSAGKSVLGRTEWAGLEKPQKQYLLGAMSVSTRLDGGGAQLGTSWEDRIECEGF